MNILAFESSCDETAVAVVRDGRTLLSDAILSQADMHALYGGVVPEIASRKHVQAIVALTDKALADAGLAKKDIDAVAVTYTPGLIGAVLVGVSFAKSAAYALGVPLIPVHHVRGHIAANYLAFPELEPPFVALAISGGNTLIVDVADYTDMTVLGATRDDAAGECFDKAARVLGSNQPNITHSMNRLESQLNCVLFIRSNRGVTLTPEGEMLYSRIASAAVQIQDAEEELSASATLEHGAICISATETALNIYLSEKLRAFHAEYPGIRLRISNHSTPQAVQAVKNGEVDFAVISTPAEVEQSLKMVELRPFYEVLVGGKTFTALASRRLTLKELSCYPLISLSDESMTRSFYRQFFLDHDAVLRPDTEAATTDQMLTLVKSELGLAFVPEPMAKERLARGELVELHLQEIIPSRSICLVYDHHRPLNTAARKFQQLLTKAGARSTERK